MKSAEQKIAEIRRPPSLANWVRLNERRRDATARRIARFVVAKPRHALTQVYRLIADYVTLAIPPETVRRGLQWIVNPLVRKLGQEIVAVLLPWLDAEDFKGIEVFHHFNVPYPIGRGIVIPVKPTFVCIRDGKLTPVFVIGWSSIPFTDFHKKLFAAIVRRSVLSLEEFEGSDALVLFVPRIKGTKTERYVRPMWINGIPDMSEDELREQFDRFGNALDDAVPVILEELARRGE